MNIQPFKAELPPAPPPPPKQAVPKDAKEADAQLESMKNDKAFRERLLRGDVAATQEWNAAHVVKAKGDEFSQVLDGTVEAPFFETVTGGRLPIRQQIEQVEEFRKLGISDASIRQAFEGAPVSAAEYAAAKLRHDELLSNKEWVARWMSGDVAAKREMTLAQIAISSRAEGF
jgi:hypothetical protein